MRSRDSGAPGVGAVRIFGRRTPNFLLGQMPMLQCNCSALPWKERARRTAMARLLRRFVVGCAVRFIVRQTFRTGFGRHHVTENSPEEKYRDADTQGRVNTDLLNRDREQERTDG